MIQVGTFTVLIKIVEVGFRNGATVKVQQDVVGVFADRQNARSMVHVIPDLGRTTNNVHTTCFLPKISGVDSDTVEMRCSGMLNNVPNSGFTRIVSVIIRLKHLVNPVGGQRTAICLKVKEREVVGLPLTVIHSFEQVIKHLIGSKGIPSSVHAAAFKLMDLTEFIGQLVLERIGHLLGIKTTVECEIYGFIEFGFKVSNEFSNGFRHFTVTVPVIEDDKEFTFFLFGIHQNCGRYAFLVFVL